MYIYPTYRIGLVNRTQFAIVPSALETWATADSQFRYLFGQLLLWKFAEVPPPSPGMDYIAEQPFLPAMSSCLITFSYNLIHV